MSKRTFVLAPLLLTGGCASLDVGVDVLNPTYLSATTQASELSQPGHLRATRFIAKVRSDLIEMRRRCFQSKIDAAREMRLDPARSPADREYAADLIAAWQLAQERAGGSAPFEEELARELNNLIAADNEARTALGGSLTGPLIPRKAKKWNLGPIEAALARRETAYVTAAQTISGLLGQTTCDVSGLTPEMLVSAQPHINRALAKAAEEIRKAPATSITGYGVLLKDLDAAYFAAVAPDDYWARRYNRAVGKGDFGNTSIALKMNDTADFSVKGFTFDGSGTAEMVKKVGTLAVTTLARSYGAPINLSPGTGDPKGPPTVEDIPSANLPELQVAAAEKAEEAYRNSLFRVADTVLGSMGVLLGSQPQVAEKSVEAIIDVQKERYTKAVPK